MISATRHTKNHGLRLLLCLFLCLFLQPGELRLVAGSKSKTTVDFNRDVRPIFSENCYACHGPDQNKRKAGLRLDRKEDAFAELKSGNHAIVSGNLAQSKLIERITSRDDDERMPPP